MTTYLIVFGAAVRQDGTPSGTLRRRVKGALALAARLPEAKVIVTGGLGRAGPTEAGTMRDLMLGAGLAPERLLVEPAATDTFESALYCDAILRNQGDAECVIPCTSAYHMPRCVVLMRLLGYRVARHPVPSDRPYISIRRLILYGLKECLALPYDAVLILWWRLRGGAKIGAWG